MVQETKKSEDGLPEFEAEEVFIAKYLGPDGATNADQDIFGRLKHMYEQHKEQHNRSERKQQQFKN